MTVQLDTGTPPPNRVELTSAAADVAVVTLIGEHDLGQYDTLAAVLARAGVGALNVIVDLTHCAFVDSITISLLLNTHAYVTGAGGGLSLVIAGRAGSPARRTPGSARPDPRCWTAERRARSRPNCEAPLAANPRRHRHAGSRQAPWSRPT